MKTNILTNIRVWAIMMVCLTVLGVGSAWGTDVTFTFNSDAGIAALGISKPSASNGTNLDTSNPYVLSGVSMAVTNGGTATRVWNSGGTLDLRVYSSTGSLTFTAPGNITDVLISGTTVNGFSANVGTYNTGTGAWSGDAASVTFTAGATQKVNTIKITYTASDPYTVNFNAQGGTCGTASLTEASGGAGVTLPAASPTAACASEGWAFYGWATARCASSTSTAPTIVGKAGDTYHPLADNTTLHAVYATGEYTKETSAITSGAKYLIVANSTKNYVMTDSYSLNGSEGQMASVQIDETSSNKYHAAAVNANWCYTIEGTAGHYYIRDVKNSSDANYIDIAYQDWYGKGVDPDDQFTITVSSSNWTLQGNWNHSKGWANEDLAFDGSDKVFIRGSGTVLLYKETTTPAYWSNPSCCDKEVAVSYNSAGSTHVSAMTFSAASTATCGGASTRQVTVSVTPISGYLFKAGDELTWTKSSGTIPAAPTLVSGPTLNAGKYEFVYEFAQNDNGAGTFAATASTLINYRTVCCTEYDIALNNSGSATGGTFSASKAKACEGNEVTLTATPDACYVFGSWTIKKHSDNSDVTTSVLAGNTLTMPDYAVDVYATFTNKTVSALSLSMTGGHQNLDIGGTNQLLVSYTPADAICDNAISSWASSNSLIISVDNSGLVTAVSAGSATITATTEGGVSNTYTITVNSPACDSWFMHHWNNSTNGDECFYQYSGTDWRTNNISLPSSSSEEKFNVNNAASNPDAKKKDVEFKTLGFADIQRGGQSCGSNPYPGQNAYGKMGIYTNSGDNNRYVAFYPDKYMVTYGKEGQPWNTLILSNTTGYEYESPVFQVPSGYKNDNTYKYYVGINNSSDAILFVTGKSSTDAMNGVSGLSSSDMGGKWGKWHIYSNSCANNWYCVFIRYYQVDFALNGGEGSIAPRYGKTTTPYVTFNTSEITPPTKSGYTFLGWSDGVNTYAPSGATVTIDGDKTLTAQWAANHTLSYNYNGGDGSSCVGGTKYTGESFTACASAGSKTGYTFAGWLGSNSVSYTAGSSYSMPDADLTLTAQWNPDVYNITYKDQGDAAYSGNKTDGRPTGNPATHTYGSATALVDGVKDGYRFDGWYTNSTCTEGPVTSIGATAKTADFTLYAKWTQIWTISWKIWNNAESRYDEYAGDGTHTTEVVAGGTISKIPTNPADNALSSCASKFMGWSETALGSDLGQSAPGDLFTTTPVGSITENKTYYAVFASINVPEKWTKTALGSITAGTYVLLDANDKAFNGTINGDKHGELTENAFSFVAGEATSAPEGICEMEFQAVSGGFKMYNPKTERFLYATAASSGKLAWAVSDDDYWYLNNSNWTYSATYSGNHPIVRTYNNLMRSYAPSTTNGIALVVAKKTPGTWKDYVTSCCGTAAVTNGGYTNVTGSGSTMSAKVTWTDAANTNRYRVVCEDLSIDAISTNKYYTTAGVMTSCTDYTFNVYAAPEGGCQSAPLEITVSPVEAAKTVTFNYNGSGQATGSFTTDCTHSSTNLPTPDAYAGHRFDGWWTLASGGSSIGAAGASYTPTADIEIFAHWVAIADLTYSGDATGTCTGTSSKDVGTSVTACTPASREHYTFDYWIRSDNSEHVNAGATFTMPAAALTLTAHWTADSYSITYKDKGNVAYSGSNSSSLPATYSYGTGVPSLPNGVKEGFRFDGWFDNSDCTGSPITTISTTATGVKTFYAKWTASHTFTFSKNGVVDGALTLGQVEGGNVIMPNTTVDCGLWTTFEGWVENDVAETTTEPATIYKPGDIYVVGSSDKEFKALYSKHEGDASVYYEKVTSGPKSGDYILVSSAKSDVYYTTTGWNSGSSIYSTAAITLSLEGTISSASATSAGANTFTIHSGHNGANVGKFAMYDGAKYMESGSSITRQDGQSYSWELLDGSTKVNDKDYIPGAGAIHSTASTTYVLQLRNHSNADRFSMYANTQNLDVYLYRKRVAGTTYYTTAPGSCDVPTKITVSYSDNKAHAGDQTITGMPSGTTLDFTPYPNFDSYTIGAAPTDPTGYHFAGWNTQADGNGDDYAAGASVTTFGYRETITLYAKWERVYTVTLYDNGAKRTELVQASEGAAVDLPAGNNCKPSSAFTFVGWTDSPVQLNAEPVRPATLHAAGAYIPTRDITLYSVYSRTIDGCDDFAAGVSGAYKFTDKASGQYALTTGNSSSYNRGSEGDPEVFFIGYSTAKSAYTIRTSEGYLGWFGASGNEALTKGNATPYYWNITEGTGGNAGYWNFTPVGVSGRQFSGNSSSKFQVHGNSTPYYIQLTKIAMTYYYNTALCGNAQITFHTGGGSISGTPTLPDGASWSNPVLSGLENCDKITTFPTATYDGWQFVGWSTEDYTNSGRHTAGTSQYAEENASTDEPDASIIYKNDGNPYVVRGGSIDLYPIFTRFPDNEPFDLEAGGRYYMYYLDPSVDDGYGAPARRYAGGWSTKRYIATTNCANATEFEFTKVGDVWHIQNISNEKWVGGKNLDDWLIENDDLGTLTDWTITIRSGNQFNASCQSGRQIGVYDNNFQAYTSNDIATNPGYHCVYLGSCEERIFSSEPHAVPTIDLIGSPIITSSVGQRVRATEAMTLSGSHLAGATKITLSGTNLTFATSATATPAANLEVTVTSGSVAETNIYVYYTPGVGDTSDGIESIIVTATDNGTVPADAKANVSVRHLPADFVIAAKWGDKWYALPNTCNDSKSSTTGVVITVDNDNDPTCATAAPSTAKWGLRQTKQPARITAGYADRLTFTERGTTATADNQQALYNYNSADVYTNAQWTNYANTNPDRYEWIPVTADFKDYTLTNASESKPLILRNDGEFKAQTTNQAYNGKVRLLPATFYEEAPVQIVEWKANSVVVMYTGTETSATTKVGTNSASASQTLSTHKLTHGIYELTTGQSLASNDGKNLLLTFGSMKKVFEIPVIITGNSTAYSGHEKQDVVIVNGGKLSAAATKYSYHNIYVYGGGKLKIASGSQLGVNNIILRAGGITTSGIGSSPSATYEYVYPQVELGGTLTSTKTDIKYEYITDYDHWYQLCLPFNATLSSIHYPQEYYGDNVTATNTGSWVIKRYAGEVRATGNYDAWKDIETEGATSVTAGHGYIFWGAPKKVSVGGAAKQRQQWGIQRITMPITAAAATSAETADKNISVDSYSDVATSDKPNDQGWNLVGNPYMVNLTDLSSNSMIAGQLVHTETVPWDGKWRNNGDDVRYVTIPDNHFDSYVAKTASVASGEGDFMPGRAFFVQIAEGASTLTFAAANRASLTPARFAQTTQSVDIETGIVMSDESKHDEVNFWIKEDKTAEYEYNADYPKTPNNTNFNIYGVHSHGDLSWIAISPEIAEGSMAIGYQVPTAGEYRLSLSETYVSDKIDQLLVTDHEMSPEITTNLLVEDYVFQVNQAETNNTRFTVSIRLAPQTPTDIGNVPGEGLNADHAKPQKFIYHDKLYILRNGVIYDATGKQVKGGLK